MNDDLTQNTWRTEQSNPHSLNLDTFTTEQIVATLLNADATVASAVQAVAENIRNAADLMVETINAGGTVHYVGSGTSGRMGVLDAVELLPTFGVDSQIVTAHLAGGDKAMMMAVEGAEDDQKAGSDLVEAMKATDLIVGLSASGRTPFVKGAFEAGLGKGMKTILIATNPLAPLAPLATVGILPDTGPEVITGSTRLKAATAQKMILNTLSTTTMVRLGKTFSNLMVDMVPTNEKLRTRAVRIVTQATGACEHEARETLTQAEGAIRVTITSLISGCDVGVARKALKSHPPSPNRFRDPSGIRTAISQLSGGAQ